MGAGWGAHAAACPPVAALSPTHGPARAPLAPRSVFINKDYKPFLRHNSTITVVQT